VKAVSLSSEYKGSAAGADAVWSDLELWPRFIDGFDHVVRTTGSWPEVGATLTWESRGGGRGTVVERVVEHQPAERFRFGFEDTQMVGEREVLFEDVDDGGVIIQVSLSYELRKRGPLAAVTELFFIRSALLDALKRELESFGHELEVPHPHHS
jgi:uncharacterized membrane protein